MSVPVEPAGGSLIAGADNSAVDAQYRGVEKTIGALERRKWPTIVPGCSGASTLTGYAEYIVGNGCMPCYCIYIYTEYMRNSMGNVWASNHVCPRGQLTRVHLGT